MKPGPRRPRLSRLEALPASASAVGNRARRFTGGFSQHHRDVCGEIAVRRVARGSTIKTGIGAFNANAPGFDQVV